MINPIPFVDFGGEGEFLHFAHPNAYAPKTFHRFIEPFTKHYHVLGMEQRPLWPNANPAEMTNWMLFADDLIAFFDQEGLRNIVGMGHSMGGVATMYAAVKRPDLFSKLVLIDPVFMPQVVLDMVASMSADDMKQHPLVQSALYRRTEWTSHQEAFDRFRTKKVFARFSDDLLWDYVKYSIEGNEEGTVSLRFPSAWEAQIYSHFPQQVWEELPKVTHPMLGIRGAETDTLMPDAWARWQSLQPEAIYIEIADVGHMMTLERPYQVAEIVLDYLLPKKRVT